MRNTTKTIGFLNILFDVTLKSQLNFKWMNLIMIFSITSENVHGRVKVYVSFLNLYINK